MGVPTASITRATADDAAELAELAAATFPLACPPGADAEAVQDYVHQSLSADRFTAYLSDPARTILVARLYPPRGERPDPDASGVATAGPAVAYAMLVHAAPEDGAVARVVEPSPATEISKFYSAPSTHGTGTASLLMDRVLEACHDRGDAGAWLGVNQQNIRARRFYRKHGFTTAGTRTFRLGDEIHDDFVLVRAL